MDTMNKILVILGITTAVFMTVCFVFVWHDKLIPDAMIVSYFGLVGTEGTVMGWIKNVKEKKKNGNDE